MRESKGLTKPQGEMKVNVGVIRRLRVGGATPARLVPFCVAEAAHERMCWDPKDGELCLRRLKPEETLVEDRSDSDVQIDRRT